MLNDFSLVIKMLWSTRSKAFLKSIAVFIGLLKINMGRQM